MWGMDVGDGWMGRAEGWGILCVCVCVCTEVMETGGRGFGWGWGGGGERMLGGYLSYCHTMRIRVYQKKKKKDKSGNSTL